MIDAYASASHYFSHIAPIWEALPDAIRGTFYVSSTIAIPARARIKVQQSRIPVANRPVIVAAYSDYRACHRRPVIFVEHGSGQTYPDVRSGAYSGGPGRNQVVLFICPNDTVAERNRASYPHIPTAVVGCPRLDALHRDPPARPSTVTIAFTFHADYRIAPETQSAFPFFRDAISAVRNAGFDVLGHAHPRAYRRLSPYYTRWNIPHTADLDEVLSRASVLVVDNSSAGFEAASLGIRIAWLSPPFYRRDIRAWPRFWDGLVLGEEATAPDEVLSAIHRALAPIPDDVAQTRDQFISTVYLHRDGHAAERAAEAIMRLMSEREAVA